MTALVEYLAFNGTDKDTISEIMDTKTYIDTK